MRRCVGRCGEGMFVGVLWWEVEVEVEGTCRGHLSIGQSTRDHMM